MGFGEPITREGGHQFPNPLADLGGHAAFDLRLFHEFALKLLHAFARVKVAHRPPEQIGFGQAEPGQLVGDAQNLLLVENDPKSFCQQGRQSRVQVLDRFLALEAAHKGLFQTARERSGPIKRQGDHEVIDIPGLDLAQGGAHPRAFDLETADGLPGLDPL